MEKPKPYKAEEIILDGDLDFDRFFATVDEMISEEKQKRPPKKETDTP